MSVKQLVSMYKTIKQTLNFNYLESQKQNQINRFNFVRIFKADFMFLFHFNEQLFAPEAAVCMEDFVRQRSHFAAHCNLPLSRREG